MLNYNGQDIRTCVVGDGEDTWYCGKDVATVLGYSDTDQAIRKNVSSEHSMRYGELMNSPVRGSCEYRTIYISNVGLSQLLISSKAPNKQHVIQWFRAHTDVELYVSTRLQKEQEYIGYIMTTLSHEEYIHQYRCGPFRVDLYFPKHKIAVECDEFGHKDRDQEYEVYRQNFITKELDCVFIRFNPDEKDFNIFSVLQRLTYQIYRT